MYPKLYYFMGSFKDALLADQNQQQNQNINENIDIAHNESIENDETHVPEFVPPLEDSSHSQSQQTLTLKLILLILILKVCLRCKNRLKNG